MTLDKIDEWVDTSYSVGEPATSAIYKGHHVYTLNMGGVGASDAAVTEALLDDMKTWLAPLGKGAVHWRVKPEIYTDGSITGCRCRFAFVPAKAAAPVGTEKDLDQVLNWMAPTIA